MRDIGMPVMQVVKLPARSYWAYTPCFWIECVALFSGNAYQHTSVSPPGRLVLLQRRYVWPAGRRCIPIAIELVHIDGFQEIVQIVHSKEFCKPK